MVPILLPLLLHLAFLACANAPLPDREELLSKTTKELKAILRSKGAKCKGCSEKEHVVDKVIETWDWAPTEASSPDGKIKMDRESFMRMLKASWSKQQGGADKKERMREGHELDEQENAMMDSDAERIWKEFSTKLQAGEITADEHGNINYDLRLGDGQPGQSFWDRHGMRITMLWGVGLMYWTRRQKRSDADREELQKEDKLEDSGHKQQAAAEPGDDLDADESAADATAKKKDKKNA
eukprot:TRINITY_DN22753_c0_g1_i1.p1 TRINITY_DN22753_c0_g1~~TRINITY_DN22753_c0_g1_i1.p1  ORF type:complete len:239 (-),score=79.20 TRINITY_DN22753_c0_g1_i1:58-774(-)